MTNPAAYPANDTEEQRAIGCFAAAIDPDRVKLEIKHRDKFPNVDGFLEIVEQLEHGKQIPIGKFDVQIRKLPKGESAYSVPSSLVAYSERTTTLPVLLICADPDENRVFWKHVTRTMPEYLPNQKSFTVRFDAAVDAIDSTNTYIARWRELAFEYQRRISRFPELSREIERFGLKGVRDEDVRYFKDFVDQINYLLDYDFRAVKDRWFGDAWKLGVAIIQPESEHVCYEIYRIPYSANAPLLISFPPDEVRDHLQFVFGRGPRAQAIPDGCDAVELSYAAHRQPPDEAARNFVFKSVERAITDRTFRVAGEAVAAELLFDYLDWYPDTVGLAPGDEYDVAALNYGFKVYLPVWYDLAVDAYFKINEEFLAQTGVFPMFETIAGILPREVRPAAEQVRGVIAGGRETPRPPLVSHFVKLGAILESIDDLLSRSVEKIQRPYVKRRTIPGRAWRGYDENGIRRNVMRVVDNMISAYRELLAANEIALKSSRFLQPEHPAIFGVNFAQWAESNEPPVVWKYRVEDPERKLKRPTVLEKHTGDMKDVWKTGLDVDGTSFRIKSAGWAMADDFFQRTPLLNTIYAMLSVDLQAQYGIRLPSHFRSSLGH